MLFSSNNLTVHYIGFFFNYVFLIYKCYRFSGKRKKIIPKKNNKVDLTVKIKKNGEKGCPFNTPQIFGRYKVWKRLCLAFYIKCDHR